MRSTRRLSARNVLISTSVALALAGTAVAGGAGVVSHGVGGTGAAGVGGTGKLGVGGTGH